MKKIKAIIVVLSIAILPAFSCGTVPGWYDYYFRHTDNIPELIHSLKLIHCEPMLTQQYDYSIEHDTMILSIVNDALMRFEETGIECFKYLAIKIFLVYGGLHSLKSLKEYQIIYNGTVDKIHRYLGRHPDYLYEIFEHRYFDWTSDEIYCARIKYELNR